MLKLTFSCQVSFWIYLAHDRTLAGNIDKIPFPFHYALARSWSHSFRVAELQSCRVAELQSCRVAAYRFLFVLLNDETLSVAIAKYSEHNDASCDSRCDWLLEISFWFVFSDFKIKQLLRHIPHIIISENNCPLCCVIAYKQVKNNNICIKIFPPSQPMNTVIPK